MKMDENNFKQINGQGGILHHGNNRSFFYGWWEMIESQHGSGGGRVSGRRAAVLHIGKACTS